MRRLSLFAAFLAFVLLALAPAISEARGGRGGSMGSRGSQTYAPPPPTRVAPAPARPVERSMTETAPTRPGTAPPTAGAPAAGAAGAAGMATRSPFMTGLMGGLLGAGLIGLLMGGGFFGAGFAGFMGLLLQLLLIGGLVWLAFRLFRRAAPEPAPAGMTPRMADGPMQRGPIPDVGANRTHGGAAGGSTQAGAFAPAMGAAAAGLTPISLDKADFDAFEQSLKDVQAAWSAADLRALSGLLTPEMLQYFSELLAEDASRGVRNQVTDVELEEGDLSEAWREAGRDYATVAMRFSARDVDTRLSDGAVIGGDAAERTVATELWTFVRASRGGKWLLSAIQQTT
jgi:predicted lipid-binding transport protein (Tim44 family)